MSELKTGQLDYGNWVSMRILYALGALAILLLGLSFVFPLVIVGAIASIVAFAYFIYARYRFSPQGGDLQAQIRELVLHRVEGTEKATPSTSGVETPPSPFTWPNASPPRA